MRLDHPLAHLDCVEEDEVNVCVYEMLVAFRPFSALAFRLGFAFG